MILANPPKIRMGPLASADPAHACSNRGFIESLRAKSDGQLASYPAASSNSYVFEAEGKANAGMGSVLGDTWLR